MVSQYTEYFINHNLDNKRINHKMSTMCNVGNLIGSPDIAYRQCGLVVRLLDRCSNPLLSHEDHWVTLG